MKNFLIVTGVLALLSLGSILGCDQDESLPRPFPPPESELNGSEILTDTEGEQQAAQEVKQLQVFEKYIKGVPFYGWLDPELGRNERERSTFRLQLEAGNRVVGEVNVWRHNDDGTTTPETSNRAPIYCSLRDPFDNLFLMSAISETPQGTKISKQRYPWNFAFFAATGGEYSLLILSGTMNTLYDANIEVTVYEE